MLPLRVKYQRLSTLRYLRTAGTKVSGELNTPARKMENNYNLLIRKIDEFIRKYYKNQLIRGLLYSVASLGCFYVALILFEYFSWNGTTTRSILFYSFLATSLAIVLRYIALPLSRLRRIGKIISREQAASIIGTHFAEVKDQLINTLQLKSLEETDPQSRELIEASISQKIRKLQPVPFTEAVNLRENRKFLRYALPPVAFLACALLISPSLITGPSARIIHHGQVFERPAPFSIEVLNPKLQAVQQDDFTVKLRITGDEIPDQFFIEAGGARYRMDKTNVVSYSYTFRNLQQNTRFFVSADQYNSKEYEIKVLPKPIILSFDVQAVYPAYLGRKEETFANTGDLTVPEGTQLNWKFYTRDTKSIQLRLGGKKNEIKQDNSNAFRFSYRMMTGMAYSVFTSNEYFVSHDSLTYVVNVIPDLYPSITVEEYKDSVYDNRLYYRGEVKDDYGLSRLTFNYAVKKNGLQTDPDMRVKEIKLEKATNQQQFYYFLDISTLFVSPGDEIDYYFEVWDNDGVHGNKSTRSQTRVFRIPTLEEIDKATEQKNGEIKDKMEQAVRQTHSLQHQIEDMNKKLVDKKELGWQEKQQLQQMLDKQQSLQQQVEQIQKENKDKSREEQQYKEVTPALIEKQKQIEKLFNEILPEEVKKMYEELQKMMENIDKDKVAEMLDKMKSDTKDLEKQLDRNLALFKQLEFEKKLQETIDKMNKLAEEQKKLSEETKDAPKEDMKKLLDKQEELNKQFEKMKEELKDLEKKNAELDEPNKMEKSDQQEESIEQEMTKSKESLKQGKGKSASQSQKNAAEEMKKLGDKLSQMQNEMEQENNAEDEAALREILDNLLRISFTQEDLMSQLNLVGTNNPKYLKIIEDQKNLKDDLKMVEDSLFALSKRQVSIEPFIMRELATVNMNSEDAMKSLNDRSVPVAKSKQQFVMTSVNNLALMLSETLKQMEQNMQAKGKGSSSGSCSKPGGQGSKMKSMRQLQEQLNKQMQQMKDGMDKPGQGQKGQKQMSEQLARMAAQQEALRKQLQDMGEEMQKQGSGTDKSLKEMLQKMDQTETDLVNKQISRETMMRQQEIVTRLLESEKALQQREMDEKRESTEAKDVFYNNPSGFFEYKKIKAKETEMIRTVPPSFKPFYKAKANSYFLSFE